MQRYSHCISAWRGGLLEKLGKKEEAKKEFRICKKLYKGKNNSCAEVDEEWLKKRE
ncbi:MAG: hypothetical protein HQK53_12690 [Oligoflexia bacterium]|nr:hypothetical protein [Oligoflexia bacterium]